MSVVRVELLVTAPVSGTFPEVEFGGGNDIVWVLFRPEFDEDWVGRFARGDMGRDSVAFSQIGGMALVISGGAGYAVDIEKRVAAFDLDLSQLQEAVALPNSEFVVAHDWVYLYVFSREGEVWRSDRVAVDGIRFTHVCDGFVTGTVNGIGEDAEFRLDAGTWRYSVSRQLLYL